MKQFDLAVGFIFVCLLVSVPIDTLLNVYNRHHQSNWTAVSKLSEQSVENKNRVNSLCFEMYRTKEIDDISLCKITAYGSSGKNSNIKSFDELEFYGDSINNL